MSARMNRSLMTNGVWDVLRRSFRRHFPLVRDSTFNNLVGKLDNVQIVGGRAHPQSR